MVDAIMAWDGVPHANVYIPLHLVRKGLDRGKRGKKSDIVATLGLAADIDTDKGFVGAVPLKPSLELETSTGNRQPFFLLERAISPAEATQLAEALHAFTGGDGGTKDIDHIWRVPGTLNWPNAVKVARGRSLVPQPVRVIAAWDGAVITAETLAAAVMKNRPAGSDEDRARPSSATVAEIVGRLPKWLRQKLAIPQVEKSRSDHIFNVIGDLKASGLEPLQVFEVLQAYPDGVGAKYSDRNDLAIEVLRSLSRIDTPRSCELRLIDPSDWHGQPVPERRWIVEDFVPASTVTLLSGEGAAGKSTLALQLAVARALGKAWLTLMPKPGRTLVLSAEDDEDELHRRLDLIRQHYGARFSDIADVRLVDPVGEDAVLGMPGSNGTIGATPLFNLTVAEIERFQPDLVIVDALADVFAEMRSSEPRQGSSLGF